MKKDRSRDEVAASSAKQSEVVARTKAKVQADYRANLKKKGLVKEVTVFIPDAVSKRIEKTPGRLVEFFDYAEKRLAKEAEAYGKKLTLARERYLSITPVPPQKRLLEECRKLGVSTTFDPEKKRKAIYDDIPQLIEQREELKKAIKKTTERRIRLEEGVQENRVEADRWKELLDAIHRMLVRLEAPEAASIALIIEAAKKALEGVSECNRKASTSFLETILARVPETRKGRRLPDNGPASDPEI